MKNLKRTIVLGFAFMLGFMVQAQDYNINFVEGKKWKQVLKMAKKQNKPIFVDAYTTWCGPCKTLAKEVFTQKKVADFFNENFINVHMDMEKGEGIALSDEWEIAAYPTLLYFSPEGKIVHRVVGAYGADEFLGYSKMALDEDMMAVNLQKRYDAGERGSEFMYNYLVSLRLGYLKEKEARIAKKFIGSMAKEDLVKKENWKTVKNFLNDPSTPEFNYILAHRAKLMESVGKEEVDAKLFHTINDQIRSWSYWTEENYGPFEVKKEQTIIQMLEETSYVKAPFLLAKLLANKYKREGKNSQYLNVMDYMVKFNLVALDRVPSQTIVHFANMVKDHFNSDVALAKALTWLDIAERRQEEVRYRASIFNAKSEILAKLGDKTQAEIAKLAAQKADKKAEAAGTKIHSIPAMKMTTGGGGK